MRKILKGIFYGGLRGCGITALIRRLNRARVPILFYHGVTARTWDGVLNCERNHVQAADFERQLAFLKANCRVVSLRRYVESLREGAPLEPYSVVLTFDDGYANNYTVAFPLLKKYGFPATFYLVNNFVNDGEPLWVDRLAAAFARAAAERLESPLAGETIPLGTQAEKIRGYLRTKRALKALSDRRREESLDKILRGLLGSRRLELPEEFAPLKREQIRDMAGSGLAEFGAHSLKHALLTSMPLEEARREIIESKARTSALSGVETESFSYPNGACDESLMQVVQEAGYSSAVAADLDLNDDQASLYALHRLAFAEGDNASMMAATLAGLRIHG